MCDGQNRARRAKPLSSLASQNIPLYRNSETAHVPHPLRPKEEGRIAIVTNAGRTAVDVSNIGAKSIAGRAP